MFTVISLYSGSFSVMQHRTRAEADKWFEVVRTHVQPGKDSKIEAHGVAMYGVVPETGEYGLIAHAAKI
jgi:hypothetical protein